MDILKQNFKFLFRIKNLKMFIDSADVNQLWEQGRFCWEYCEYTVACLLLEAS